MTVAHVHVVASRALTVAIAALLAGCGSRVTATGASQTSRPAAGASALGTDNCDSRNRTATFTGRVVLSFTGARAGEAVVRIEGTTYRSTVRVDVATGTTLELRDDTYRVRVAVPDYRAVEKTVQVVCGKEQALPIALSTK